MKIELKYNGTWCFGTKFLGYKSIIRKGGLSA